MTSCFSAKINPLLNIPRHFNMEKNCFMSTTNENRKQSSELKRHEPGRVVSKSTTRKTSTKRDLLLVELKHKPEYLEAYSKQSLENLCEQYELRLQEKDAQIEMLREMLGMVKKF